MTQGCEQLSHVWLLAAVPDWKPNWLPLDCKFDGLLCAPTPPTVHVLSLYSVRYDCVIEHVLLLITDVKLLSWNYLALSAAYKRDSLLIWHPPRSLLYRISLQQCGRPAAGDKISAVIIRARVVSEVKDCAREDIVLAEGTRHIAVINISDSFSVHGRSAGCR